MSDKTIPTITWDGGEDGEAPAVWRVDEAGAGDSFFRFLTDNSIKDGTDRIKLKMMTQAEWAECIRLGEEGF